MTSYESEHHDPPAPVAWIRVVNPASDTAVDRVPMLIDSGADVTLIPKTIVTTLGLELVPDKSYLLEGFEGTRISAAAARATLKLDKYTFKGQWLFDDREIGVLGRNVLNMVLFELDGPNLVWRIRSS